jgi:transcriptional regulator with XRE-family HTH domain
MQNINRLMKLNGWNQDELGAASGVSQGTISKAIKGYGGVSLKTYRAIAKALDVKLYVLFMDDSDEAELRIIKTYRGISQDQQQIWDDMASSARDRVQKASQ